MVRGIAMTTDTCRPPGDGTGFRAYAVTRIKRIQDLRRMRDLLLPRLLSGQVNLSTKTIAHHA